MSVFDDYHNINNPKYDNYLPADNLGHQQYDNYGIYSLAAITHCDFDKEFYQNNFANGATVRELSAFVAYQKYDVNPITVNFRAIVERYSHAYRRSTSRLVPNPSNLRYHIEVVKYPWRDEPYYQGYFELLYAVKTLLEPVYEAGNNRWVWQQSNISYTYRPEIPAKIYANFNSVGGFSSSNSNKFKNYAWAHKDDLFPNVPPFTSSTQTATNASNLSFYAVPFANNNIDSYYNSRIEITSKSPDPVPGNVKPTGTYWGVQFYFTSARVRQLPCYEDLIGGYNRDRRKIPSTLEFTAPTARKLRISYYRNNPYETTPNTEYLDQTLTPPKYVTAKTIKTIDWKTVEIELQANKVLEFNCENLVLGTLQIIGLTTDLSIIHKLPEDPSAYLYPLKYLYADAVALDELFDIWSIFYSNVFWSESQWQLFNLTDKKLKDAGYWYPNGMSTLVISEGYNNYWNNYIEPDYTNFYFNQDIDGFYGVGHPRGNSINLKYHPFFNAYDPDITKTNYLFDKLTQSYYSIKYSHIFRHFIEPQFNDKNQPIGIGSIVMDSPRTIETHAALNAGKWGVNPDNPNEVRKDDLGWRIQRLNEVLGIRVGSDGKFDPAKEKKIVRQVIPSNKQLDAQKVGVNNFGDDGMVIKRINNRFNGDKIESDQCVIIHDLLQLIQEYHEQHNLAIGLQESSAIEIKDPKDEKGKNKARFDNQLGLLLEIFNLLSSANEMTRANLISSLITQSQTSEVIAGLGLPSVTKTIPIKIDKEVTQLPYKGIAPHRSISQEVATCTANVGIVLGQLL